MSTHRAGRARVLVLVGGVVAVDQFTKFVAHRTGVGGAVRPVFNPDAALGLVRAPVVVLVLGAMAVLVVVALWQRSARSTSNWRVVALFAAGAVSNLVDRVLFGAVRDFVPTPWMVFNLADVAIAVAIVGFYVDLIPRRIRKEVTP